MSSDYNGPVGKQNGFSGARGSEASSYHDPRDPQGHGRKNSMDTLLARQIPPQMTTKVKGLLKGLRYISQMFEPGREQEMQIGYPTDVKHVAHIGWDGPSATPPTWINEYRPTQDMSTTTQSAPAETKEPQKSPTKKSSRGSRHHTNGDTKSSRHSQTQDSSNDESDAPKTSRRHRQYAATSPSSSTGEASDMPRQSRRNREKSSSGLDSSTKDSSGAQNHTRRKKSSRSEGGSTRASRSEGGSSRPRSRAPSAANSDSETKNREEQPTATKSKEEEEIQST